MTPEGLLDAAEALVPPGRGRPSRARIRRSISTAYYALFTAFTAEIARPYRRNVKATARRLVEHGKARSVCETLKGNNRGDDNLREFAKRFVLLYLSRQRADYDHTYEPDKSDAQEAIERARYAIDYLSQARTTCPDRVQMMCVTTIASDTQRKHMSRQSGRGGR